MSASPSNIRSINLHTGRPLEGVEHLRASIRTLLTTPLGARLERRAYGSQLFELIDRNFNALTRAQIIAATADALHKWEPRFLLKDVKITSGLDKIARGHISLTLEGVYLESGDEVTLDGVVL